MRWEFEGLRLDDTQRMLSRVATGEVIRLRAKVFDLLLYLVRRPGELVSREQLLAALWPTVVVEDNSLERAVSTLRRSLGEKAGENRFIETEARHGYRFVAAVIAGARSDDAPPDPGILPVAAIPRSRAMVLAVAAMLAIALMVLLLRESGSPEIKRDATAYASQRPSNMEAWRLYLQAHDLRSNGAGNADYARALELLDRAVQLEPGFARARAEQAQLHFQLAAFGVETSRSLDAAEVAARAALDADATLMDAWATLGGIHAMRGQWIDAENAFQQANPVSGLAQGLHAYALASLGHLQAALRASDDNVAQDPRVIGALSVHASIAAALGLNDMVLRDVRQGESLGAPTPYVPVMQFVVAVRERHHDRALDMFRRMTATLALPGDASTVMSDVLHALDNPNEAPDAARRLRTIADVAQTRDRTGAAWALPLLTALGDLDSAYEVAQRRVEPSDGALVGANWHVLWWPEMQRFRDDPRFMNLVERLGMPPFWKAHGPPDGCVFAEGKLTRCDRDP